MTIIIEDAAGLETTVIAFDYKWYYEFFLAYTNTSMDFFHKDNLASITVDGNPIPLPN
jgi:hypothetical protein